MTTNNNSSSSIGTTSYQSRLPSSHSLQTDMNVVGGWTVATPFCRCNHYCVLKTAKTRINYGRQFWRCRNYKGPHAVGCNYFDWFDKIESNHNDFGPQISELEKLVDEKNLKIKECEFKLQEKDMKIGSQRKKIKKMKEEILTTKKNMKLVTFGGFVLLSLIVILVAMIWSIIAP
ncbi:GRF zinc finger / Zinc knuckle protein [Trifolium repens]|nr:GRF zinc finger / Zinc knuckle protein [Trifolium repens]